MYKTRITKGWAVYTPTGRFYCARSEKQAAINCAMSLPHRHTLETWNDLSANGWTLEEVEITVMRLKR